MVSLSSCYGATYSCALIDKVYVSTYKGEKISTIKLDYNISNCKHPCDIFKNVKGKCELNAIYQYFYLLRNGVFDDQFVKVLISDCETNYKMADVTILLLRAYNVLKKWSYVCDCNIKHGIIETEEQESEVFVSYEEKIPVIVEDEEVSRNTDIIIRVMMASDINIDKKCTLDCNGRFDKRINFFFPDRTSDLSNVSKFISIDGNVNIVDFVKKDIPFIYLSRERSYVTGVMIYVSDNGWYAHCHNVTVNYRFGRLIEAKLSLTNNLDIHEIYGWCCDYDREYLDSVRDMGINVTCVEVGDKSGIKSTVNFISDTIARGATAYIDLRDGRKMKCLYDGVIHGCNMWVPEGSCLLLGPGDNYSHFFVDRNGDKIVYAKKSFCFQRRGNRSYKDVIVNVYRQNMCEDIVAMRALFNHEYNALGKYVIK